MLMLQRGSERRPARAQGLDRVIICVAQPGGKIHLRQCVMKYKKSGTRVRRDSAPRLPPSVAPASRSRAAPPRSCRAWS